MTTDPIRDEAVKVLAEALEQSIGMLRRRPEKAQEVAAAILDASPTLARRLALGTAWDAAVAVLPEGWTMKLDSSAPTYWWAVARPDDDGRWLVTDGFPTPELALAALAAKLGSGK